MEAAVTAAQAQVTAAQAAVAAARTQVSGARATVTAAVATVQRIKVDIDDSTSSRRATAACNTASRSRAKCWAGRQAAQPGGLEDVYMTFFVPETVAGKLALGSEARIVLDAARNT
jgi:HlyD family secretion protein